LREKIFIVEKRFNDIEMELTKMAVLRNCQEAHIGANIELRLTDVQGESLIMSWLVAETGEVIDSLAVAGALYDEIAADHAGWHELREALAGRLFIDMQRLMLPVA
jgi:hypothetical protein